MPAQALAVGGLVLGWSRPADWKFEKTELLEVLDFLQLPNDPAIGTGSHQHDIMSFDALIVDFVIAVNNLKFVLCGVMQFDHVSFWGIEDGFNFVTLIEIARAHATAALIAHRVV